MLMACRCLFSTRCLHTWLDPRGISEMFLAPIRNHILLLSSLSLLPLFPPPIPLPLSPPLLPPLSLSLCLVHSESSISLLLALFRRRVAVVAFVVLDRPSLTSTTSRSLIFSAAPLPQICLRSPFIYFREPALTLARRTSIYSPFGQRVYRRRFSTVCVARTC